MYEITVTPSLIYHVKELAENYSKSTGADPPEYYEEYYLHFVPHANIISTIGEDLGFSQKDNILEVGSGLGTRCLIGNAIFGANFTGVEPCANTYSSLKKAIGELKRSNPNLGYSSLKMPGENTGLPTNGFDYVLTFEVMEHVEDKSAVIQEMFRVLKPGGKLFLSTCNYDSFYEGHFRCLWLPFLGRKVLKKYLKFQGVNECFLEEINLITKKELLGYLRDTGFANIKTFPCYQFREAQDLRVNFPDNYDPVYPYKKEKIVLNYLQSNFFQRLLSLFDREYKLYIIAEKI